MEMCILLKLKDSNFTVWDIVLIPLLSATITGGKLALAVIPNVEIVSLLFVVYATVFGLRKTLLISVIFTTTEVFLYGFNTWLLGYFFVWPLLIVLAVMIHKISSNEWPMAILSLVFGLSFGLLFAIFESFFYGFAYGLAYWLRGIPFDLVHGASNFIVAIFLYAPLYNLLSRLRDQTSYSSAS